MRIARAIFLLSLSSMCFADRASFDLMQVAHMSPKGRVQDHLFLPSDQQITAILTMGKEAIPLLIDALESERRYERPLLDFWPKMVEGDVALVVLSDLFLDPTWLQSSLRELCWDTLLERTSDSITAWDLLDDFVSSHGRAMLANRWRQAWAKYGSKMRWNPAGQFFQVEGRELTSC